MIGSIYFILISLVENLCINDSHSLIMSMDRADNGQNGNQANNQTFSRDFRLIVGASFACMRLCPGGPIKKGVAGTTAFGFLGSFYTVNSFIRNPEGVNQMRRMASDIITRSNSGIGENPGQNIRSFLDNSKLPPVNLPEDLNLLFVQYNGICMALYITCICILVTVIVLMFNLSIYKFKDKILSYVTNKWIIRYIKYQFILLKVYFYLGPLLMLFGLGTLLYGLNFLVNNPLPEWSVK